MEENIEKKLKYKEKFDFILMSEVIYAVENYEKLCNLIFNILEEKGICIMGSKMYYYGVGGSSNDFKLFV